ncbi:hypothetical protein [Glaciimonas sp. PCH181]|uniref:hypothetical protein n=1 Tax=Glaciimonas sp. PCH181 TaxID=2133943 RepID=UPI000D38401A|nr:hypothetical protein [Glaciimonas sp. PCH181]PUA20411.1 hypothetical protein C7W93_11855 [Glaciimonas sp. PCH181]
MGMVSTIGISAVAVLLSETYKYWQDPDEFEIDFDVALNENEFQVKTEPIDLGLPDRYKLSSALAKICYDRGVVVFDQDGIATVGIIGAIARTGPLVKFLRPSRGVG